AYLAAGVSVERLDAPALVSRPLRAPPAALAPAVPVEERSAILIPEDWRELNYNRPKAGRDFTLRGIAAMLSEEPVINRDMAVEVIEAELRRRRSEETASNGLTRREMNADLEAAGAEIDPAEDIEALAA